MAKEEHRLGKHRAEYNRNKARILKTQSICGICGKPVDKTLKYPHPMSPTIDHIIPLAKGGHPAALENLQLAHFCCNRQKSDRLTAESEEKEENVNRILPWSMDWKSYRARKV